VYVWIDALINYLTGVGYPDESGSRQWREAQKIHVIGKNVWKFHAVYWPALLLSARLTVPEQIVVHGFLTNEGRKISKSSGDAVDPIEYVNRFGVDAVRYFLLRHVQPFDDADFSETRLAAASDSDLANGIGNLVSRVCALCEPARVAGISPPPVPDAPKGYHEHLAALRFDLAIGSLWDEITRLNQEITARRPWEYVKAGRHAEARSVLSPLVERLAAIGYWLSPFLPSTSAAIRERLQQTLIRPGRPLFRRTVAS
jgi:methionyl-tRNA synthetase